MEKKIAEKFLLLALHPEKARYKIGSQHLSAGLIGAILFDLTLDKKLSIEGKFLKPLVSGVKADDAHGIILKKILEREKPRKIKNWVSRLNTKSRKYRFMIFEEMERKRLVSVERKKFLFIPYKVARLRDIKNRNRLMGDLRTLVLDKKRLNDENAALLSLAYACKMHKILGKNKEENKKIKTQLKDILNQSAISGEVDKVIKEMQAAVTIAVTTAVIASSASSS